MIRQLFSTLVALLVLWIPPAMAYIDPGSGSAVMSAIIGFFVAAGLVIKTYWYKLKGLFFGKKAGPNKNELNKESNSEPDD